MKDFFQTLAWLFLVLFATDPLIAEDPETQDPVGSVSRENKEISVGHLADIREWLIAEKYHVLITIDALQNLKIFDLETAENLFTDSFCRFEPFQCPDLAKFQFHFPDEKSVVIQRDSYDTSMSTMSSFFRKRKTDYWLIGLDEIRTTPFFAECPFKPEKSSKLPPYIFVGTSFFQLRYYLSRHLQDKFQKPDNWESLPDDQKHSILTRYIQNCPYPRLVEWSLRNAFTKIADAQTAATFHSNGDIAFWNIKTGKTNFIIKTDLTFSSANYPKYLQQDMLQAEQAAPIYPTNVRFFDNGKILVLFNANKVFLYDLVSKEKIYETEADLHDIFVNRIQMDYIENVGYCQSLLTIQTANGGMEVHNVSTGEKKCYFDSRCFFCVLSPLGDCAIVQKEKGPGNRQRYLWNFADEWRKVPKQMSLNGDLFWSPYQPNCIYFMSMSGSDLLNFTTVPETKLMCWNLQTQKLKTISKMSSASDLELSEDSRFILFSDGEDHFIKYDLTNNQQTKSFEDASNRFWDDAGEISFEVEDVYQIVIYNSRNRQIQTTYRFAENDFLIDDGKTINGSPEGMKRVYMPK